MLLRRYKDHQMKKPDGQQEDQKIEAIKEPEKVQEEVQKVEQEAPKKRNTRKKSE